MRLPGYDNEAKEGLRKWEVMGSGQRVREMNSDRLRSSARVQHDRASKRVASGRSRKMTIAAIFTVPRGGGGEATRLECSRSSRVRRSEIREREVDPCGTRSR